MKCPHCEHELTGPEVFILHQQYASQQRKSKRGGRPPFLLERIRQHNNAVYGVGPEDRRRIVPVDEEI